MSNQQPATPEEVVARFRRMTSRTMQMGLFVGVGAVIMIFLSFSMKGIIGSLLGFVLLFAITYYVYRETIRSRHEIYNNNMSYLNALVFFMWVTFFASLIVMVGTYLMMYFLLSSPGFIESMSTALDQTMTVFPELADSSAEIKDLIFSLTPFDWAAQMVTSFFMVSFFMSMIMAIFVRSNNRNSYQGNNLDDHGEK